MSAPTLVRGLSAEPLDIALREPFGIAGGAHELARNVLVTIELSDGTLGFGEAAPLPPYNGETQSMALEAIETARPLVEGADARGLRRLAAALGEAIGPIGSARCALETALLDALLRRAKLPMWAFFGGAETELRTDMTIPTGSPERAREAALAIARQGYERIKVKVGGPLASEDEARVAAVHEAAPACSILLDANGGCSAESAIALVRALASRGVAIALFEQPVAAHDLDGMRRVAEAGRVRVAADESVVTAADALRVARERAAQVVNVKPMKAGLVEASVTAVTARAAGLELMIGGMVESTLAMTASACLAAGHGGFAFVDLDTPPFLVDEPMLDGLVRDGERLDVAGIGAGHGVTPRARRW